MMNEKQRREIIPDLDQFTDDADNLKKEIGYFMDKYSLYKDGGTVQASNDAFKLVASLKNASDQLKRAGADYVQSCVASWHDFRLEDDESDSPIFASITYSGNDAWEVVMVTLTHGRERIIVHSNAATWAQVYSSDPV